MDNDRSMERIRRRFNEADVSNNGELNRYEFLNLLKSFRVDLGPDQLTHLMRQMDTDGGGTICFEEFIATGIGEQLRKMQVTEQERSVQRKTSVVNRQVSRKLSIIDDNMQVAMTTRKMSIPPSHPETPMQMLQHVVKAGEDIISPPKARRMSVGVVGGEHIQTARKVSSAGQRLQRARRCSIENDTLQAQKRMSVGRQSFDSENVHPDHLMANGGPGVHPMRPSRRMSLGNPGQHIQVSRGRKMSAAYESVHIAMSICPEGDEEQLEQMTSSSPPAPSRLPSFQEMHEDGASSSDDEKSNAEQFSDAEIAEFCRYFWSSDENNDGRLSKTEFMTLINALGMKLRKLAIDRAFTIADTNHDGMISFTEFISAYLNKNETFDVSEQRIKDVFNRFDHRGRGLLTKNQCLQAFKCLGYQSDPQRLEKMMVAMDLNQDGQISLNEFCSFLDVRS